MSFPGQLAAGTCEIVTLDKDSSQPRRTIARQTARCACKKGQIAGTTRARPACVDGKKQRVWGMDVGGLREAVDGGLALFLQGATPAVGRHLRRVRLLFVHTEREAEIKRETQAC